MSEDLIINKVAESGLITLDLADYLPREKTMSFDLKDYLFMGLILKEKDFRQAISVHDWKQYEGSAVAVFCSADAIIPNWAYMLVASQLEGIAAYYQVGTVEEITRSLMIENIRRIGREAFNDARLVIKGCGDETIEAYAYLEITKLLKPVAKSIMYGEPCSTVPVYKKVRSKE